MAELISDIVGYLKAVFVESQQLVFTAFDILGIALFFFPNLAGRLIGNESLVRTIGGFIFLGSFILANFLVYRRVAGEMSGKANIELKVLAKDFSPSLGTRPSPFRGVRGNPGVLINKAYQTGDRYGQESGLPT